VSDNDFEAVLAQADEALSRGQFAQAERLARGAAELAPTSPRPWLVMARSLRGRGAHQ